MADLYIDISCGKVPWTEAEWDRIRNIRGRLAGLYEDAGTFHVRCVLCDKRIKDHPFAMKGHGDMHARRGEAVPHFSAREYRVAPSPEQMAVAPSTRDLEVRDEQLDKLRAEVRPLAIVRREADNRAARAEKVALEAIRSGIALDDIRHELIAAELAAQEADNAVDAKLAEYPDEVSDMVTVGDLAGFDDDSVAS